MLTARQAIEENRAARAPSHISTIRGQRSRQPTRRAQAAPDRVGEATARTASKLRAVSEIHANAQSIGPMMSDGALMNKTVATVWLGSIPSLAHGARFEGSGARGPFLEGNGMKRISEDQRNLINKIIGDCARLADEPCGLINRDECLTHAAVLSHLMAATRPAGWTVQ